jgi:hypothetical protein
MSSESEEQQEHEDYVLTYSHTGETIRMWVCPDTDKNSMMDDSPFVSVEEFQYPDNSKGFTTYLLPGSQRGDLMGPSFTWLGTDEQMALATPYERLHQRQLQRGSDGALQLAWEEWEKEKEESHAKNDRSSWSETWLAEYRPSTHLNGIGVYSPRMGDVLPRSTTTGNELAQCLQNRKIPVSYVDEATHKVGINCMWSEKYCTMIQCVDVPAASTKVRALTTYGDDPALQLQRKYNVEEDANGAAEAVPYVQCHIKEYTRTRIHMYYTLSHRLVSRNCVGLNSMLF